MLEQRLKEIIPETTFPALESGDTYYFDHWDVDRHGKMCLYYRVWKKNRTKKNKTCPNLGCRRINQALLPQLQITKFEIIDSYLTQPLIRQNILVS